MSFSSTSSLASADLSMASSPPSTPSSPPSKSPSTLSASCSSSSSSSGPDFKRLERILLSLIHLARATYSPHLRSNTSNGYYHARQYDQYTRVLARLAGFFQRPVHRNSRVWVESGTWGYILEMAILLRLVESGLGVGHVDVEGLCGGVEGIEGEERKEVERRVNLDVEFLVFKGAELDCERLPWNLGEMRLAV